MHDTPNANTKAPGKNYILLVQIQPQRWRVNRVKKNLSTCTYYYTPYF